MPAAREDSQTPPGQPPYGDDCADGWVARISAALTSSVRDLSSRPLPAGLHLVATPIGNLGDITPRALVTLAKADEVYCEDTRLSRPMLARFGVERRLKVYHEHNAAQAREAIVGALEEGRTVALISDAGMPGISDPGYKLTRAAQDAGYCVYTVPGASAVTAAITVSGLASDRFLFAGFLPHKAAARRNRINELSSTTATLVVYESPHRLASALKDLHEILGDREAAVTRELTKKFEEVRRGPLGDLCEWARTNPPRGEIVIVVDGAALPRGDDVDDAAIMREHRR